MDERIRDPVRARHDPGRRRRHGRLGVLPVEEWPDAFGAWTARLGAVGAIAVAALFVLATLPVVLGTPLAIAGGVAFGRWAMPLVMVAATPGSVLTYLAARSLLRERVRSLFVERPAVTATVEAVGDADWRLLTLMRLGPFVPFSAQNGFGDRAGRFRIPPSAMPVRSAGSARTGPPKRCTAYARSDIHLPTCGEHPTTDPVSGDTSSADSGSIGAGARPSGGREAGRVQGAVPD